MTENSWGEGKKRRGRNSEIPLYGMQRSWIIGTHCGVKSAGLANWVTMCRASERLLHWGEEGAFWFFANFLVFKKINVKTLKWKQCQGSFILQLLTKYLWFMYCHDRSRHLKRPFYDFILTKWLLGENIYWTNLQWKYFVEALHQCMWKIELLPIFSTCSCTENDD